MNPDFEFRHHLYDTIILLGGKEEIARMLKKSQDYQVTEEDIESLLRYNWELTTLAKDRLANLNTIKVRTRPKG